MRHEADGDPLGPDVSLAEVQSFWNEHPCDADTSRSAREELRFFEEVERRRYEKEWHIPAVAGFGAFRGKRVLEIGCGLGSDAASFAAAGARYTGVDLTREATRLTRSHLGLKRLPGGVVQTNAESLPFADGSFDHVYSYGVVHHSPDPDRIMKEVSRVLVPGGTVCVMVYHKSSINYWFEIMFLRRVLRYLLAPLWAARLAARVTGFPEEKVLQQRRLFLSPAARDPKRWLSMNTDGPECPLARVYTRTTGKGLLAPFSRLSARPYFFDKSHYPFVGRLIPRSLEGVLGRAWGWHLVVTGEKPAGS